MIKDAGGIRVSPRQKAAEVLIARQGVYSGLSTEDTSDMTEREISLVNKQMEKLYNKAEKVLQKARKEAGEDELTE
jgi:hypothetical protein